MIDTGPWLPDWAAPKDTASSLITLGGMLMLEANREVAERALEEVRQTLTAEEHATLAAARDIILRSQKQFLFAKKRIEDEIRAEAATKRSGRIMYIHLKSGETLVTEYKLSTLTYKHMDACGLLPRDIESHCSMMSDDLDWAREAIDQRFAHGRVEPGRYRLTEEERAALPSMSLYNPRLNTRGFAGR